MADKKISQLAAVTTPALTDQFVVNQGGTTKRATLEQVRDVWTTVTFTRASDSTLTVPDNAANQAIFIAGRPIRYRATAGTWRYGVVVNYASGTVTLDGAALTTSDDDEMAYADTDRLKVLRVFIGGNLETGDDQFPGIFSGLSESFIIRAVASLEIAATGTGDVSIAVGVGAAGNDLMSSTLNLTTAETEVDSGVTISTTHYNITFSERVYVNVDSIGGTNPGGGLILRLYYVLP